MTARIPRSLTVAGLAAVGSVGVHLAALAWQPPSDRVEIEGGGGTTMTMEGTSFADMAQGRLEAVSPDGADAVQPSGTLTSQSAPLAVIAPVANEVSKAVTPSAEVVSRPVSEPAPMQAALPDQAEAAPDGPAETVEAVGETTTPRVSARPRGRPAAVEARAAAHRTEDAEPAPRQAGRASAEASQPTRRGNEAAVDATRGASGGSDMGQAARSGAGQAQAAGNAAASNYPGQIQARILRQRMPRDAGRGTARVSFTVAADGGLAALGLAASSGSGTLDRAALQIVQRAAPFPAPPAGAQRAYVIPVQGR